MKQGDEPTSPHRFDELEKKAKKNSCQTSLARVRRHECRGSQDEWVIRKQKTEEPVGVLPGWEEVCEEVTMTEQKARAGSSARKRTNMDERENKQRKENGKKKNG